jgi:L-ornithine N5-oxygenase
MGGRNVVGLVDETVGDGPLRIKVGHAVTTYEEQDNDTEVDGPIQYEGEDDEILEADLIITATGYQRTAHVNMLREAWPLLPAIGKEQQDKHRQGKVTTKDRWLVRTDDTENQESTTRVLEVSRDYSVQFSPGAVADGSGIWLQGCCEGTHGVSPISFAL